jgi:hypothetical protein
MSNETDQNGGPPNTGVSEDRSGFVHYINIDEQNNVTGGWSDGIYEGRTPTEADIPIRTDGGKQFVLFPDRDGGDLTEDTVSEGSADSCGYVHRYRWAEDRVIEKTPEEIADELGCRRIAALAEEIRTERNRRIAAVDWTQHLNVPMTDEKQDEWGAYIQKLRDIPEQEGFPEAVEWPVKPE